MKVKPCASTVRTGISVAWRRLWPLASNLTVSILTNFLRARQLETCWSWKSGAACSEADGIHQGTCGPTESAAGVGAEAGPQTSSGAEGSSPPCLSSNPQNRFRARTSCPNYQRVRSERTMTSTISTLLNTTASSAPAVSISSPPTRRAARESVLQFVQRTGAGGSPRNRTWRKKG